MFKKIKITHFKAFERNFSIDFNKKNFLAYGDNGSGKSSLYQALILALDYNRFKREATEGFNEDDERYQTELISALNEKFLCQYGDGDFHVELDDIPFDSFDSSGINVFCIDSRQLECSKEINLQHLLMQVHCHCRTYDGVEHFLQVQGELLLTNANNVLRDVLFEDVVLGKKDDYSITMHDVIRNFTKDKLFDSYFNESKIHLVKLVLLIESAKLMMEEVENSYLILDDVVSSLDTANRTCIMHYLMNDSLLNQVHRMILTHNMNFFNIMRFAIDDANQSADWQIGRIYELENEHRYFDWGAPESDFNEIIANVMNSPQETGADIVRMLGNRLRQLLERYVKDYWFLTHTVLRPNTGELINSLLKLDPHERELEFYKFEDGEILPQSAAVIKDIKKVLRHDCHDEHKEKRDLVMDIEAVFNKYKDNDNWKSIKDSLSKVKLLLKTSLHPLSHDMEAQMTMKELKVTAQYVQKLKEKMVHLYEDNIDLNN